MRRFIFLIFICLSLKAKPQAYVQMLNSHAEWHVTNCNFGCITDKYFTIGDTIIDGFHFKFLDLYHYMKNFVLREDTILRRIYMRFLDSPKPGEYLLYDFGLNINDSVDVFNPNSPYPESAGKFVLDSILPKFLLNKTHRYFYLHSLDTTSSLTKNTVWVEGIGSLCLINTPGAPPQINGVGRLSCFFNGGIQEYEDLDSITVCQSIYPESIQEEMMLKSTVKLFPNPTNDVFEINSEIIDLEGKTMEIINSMGIIVDRIKFKKSIDVSVYQKGMYFVRILTDSKFFTLKFIKD